VRRTGYRPRRVDKFNFLSRSSQAEYSALNAHHYAGRSRQLMRSGIVALVLGGASLVLAIVIGSFFLGAIGVLLAGSGLLGVIDARRYVD
jgi:hypothetical protein